MLNQTFRLHKFILIISILLLILTGFINNNFSNAQTINEQSGNIIINISPENPAQNQEVLLTIQVIDYRMLSTSNLPLNISLRSSNEIVNYNIIKLSNKNTLTDNNGIYTSYFNAPTSLLRDENYEIFVEAKLSDGIYISGSLSFFVEEKIFDPKFDESPIPAPPGTWYGIKIYDIDFTTVTIKIKQNNEPYQIKWNQNDWTLIGSSSEGIKGNENKNEIISEIFLAENDYAIMKRDENIQSDHYYTTIFKFLVTEIFGNNIEVSFSGFIDNTQNSLEFVIPSIKLNNSMIGITGDPGEWYFKSCYNNENWKEEFLGTCKGSTERIYAIGLTNVVSIDIYYGSLLILNQLINSNNYLAFYKWEVSEDFEEGKYLLIINGTDMNNKHFSYEMEFYVGESDSKSNSMKSPTEDDSNRYILFLVPLILIIIMSFLYSRLKRSSLLNNLIRKRIFDYIETNPRINFRAILNNLNLNPGTLSHHINVLEDFELITSRQEGMYRIYYISGKKPELIKRLPEIQIKILNIIFNKPGLSQSHIARTIGRSRAIVNYHIKILAESGMVSIEKEGNKSKCYPL